MNELSSLLKQPLKIVRLPPINNPNNGSVNTLLAGGLPVNVYNAIKKEKKETIKEFFGRDWKYSIGQDLPKLVIGGDPDFDSPAFIDVEKLINEEMEREELEKEQLADNQNTNNGGVRVEKIKKDSTIKMHPADIPLPADGVEYSVVPIIVFPEDRMYELKEKIYVATGVPVQRQHIFWVDDNNSARTTYKMKTADGGEIYIDARNIVKGLKEPAKTNNIFGLEIDKYLYDNNESITVIAMDTFKTVEDYILGTTSVIYLIDLADVLYSDEMRFTIANDKARRDLLYRSVIFKYWPWITEEIFAMAVNNEDELAINYPQLAPNREKLEERFMVESSILSYINPGIKNNVDITITMAITSVSTGTRINIRNLFDKIETSRDCPNISAYISDGALKYNVVKHHIGTPSVIFPNQTRSGITIAIPIDPDELYSREISRQTIAESLTGSKKTYLFLNIQTDGTYYVLSHWDDDNKIDFNILINILMERVNPVILQINQYKDYIFMGTIKEMVQINRVNARYPDINISLIWKHYASEGDFKIMKDLWLPYEEAGIVKIKPITFGSHQGALMEMNLFKGCTEYDINQIARSSVLSKVKNYYKYLTDPLTNQVWNNMYHGRLIKMNQRTSDVQFELFNVSQNNFIRFQSYLNGYINNIKKNDLLGKVKSEKRKNIKKLKLLQETDPELYDLRKHGSNRLYAVLCQEQRQPIVTSTKKNNAIEYFNYTTGEPIYYYCDSNEHPVMSFIAGVHPKGYCLPCCKKKMAVIGTDKYKEHESCMKYGINKVDQKEDTGKLPPGSNRHIMAFGKELPKYRLGLPPKEITDFIISIIGDESQEFYMYGVDQNYPGATAASGAGILAALAMPIGVKPANLASTFIKYLKVMNVGYESLMNGEIVEWFENVDSLIGTIHKIFIAGEFGTLYFDRWIDLFSELFRLIYNMEVVIMTETNIEYSGSADNLNKPAIILIRFDEFVYPLVRLNLENYFKNNEVSKPIFKENIAGILNNLLGRTVSNSKTELSNLISIIAELGKFKLCITNQRIAYGFISDKVFITFKPTHIQKGLETTDAVPEPGEKKQSADVMKLLAKKLGGELKDTDDHISLYVDKQLILRAHISLKDKDVWQAVLAGRENIFNSISDKAISKHNMYNLFLMEFIAWADKNKNKKVRDKLYSLIDELNISNVVSFHKFVAELKLLITYNTDIGYINNVIAQNLSNKKNIIKQIEDHKFIFDKNNYNVMHEMPADELREIVKQFVTKHIDPINDLPDPPKNLTLPQKEKRLKMHSADIEPMSELLVADIQNPLKMELMKSGALSSYLLLNIFDFERRPNETIKIMQV